MKSPASILIVDKTAEVRSFLYETLENQGYRIHCVDARSAALNRLQTQPFDVVILEHGFARDDGLQMIREIKAVDPHIMVIVLTSQPEIEKIIRIMRGNGAFDVLIKPLKNIKILRDSVSNALLQRQQLTRRSNQLQDLMEANRELQGQLSKNGMSTPS